VTPLVAVLGLRATPLLALPGLAVSAILLARLGHLRCLADRVAAPGGRASRGTVAPADAWWPFSRLVAAAVARTAAFFALQAFVPVYLIARYGASPTTAGLALTTMLVAGALGTLAGGRWADRIGRRRLLVGAMVALVPLLILLPHVGLVAAFVVLAGVGFTVDSPFATTVVLGQDYLPRHVGLSSGITYGLAIGLGGLRGHRAGRAGGRHERRDGPGGPSGARGGGRPARRDAAP
jgi:FSR family fosmidomycin resistance protein-like MFS transporter